MTWKYEWRIFWAQLGLAIACGEGIGDCLTCREEFGGYRAARDWNDSGVVFCSDDCAGNYEPSDRDLQIYHDAPTMRENYLAAYAQKRSLR